MKGCMSVGMKAAETTLTAEGSSNEARAEDCKVRIAGHQVVTRYLPSTKQECNRPAAFLGAFANLRKETISFVMSVHPSFRME